MSSEPFQEEMTKEEFFTYFRETEPLKEGQKNPSMDNILTIEDLASYDSESWKNLSSIFRKSGVSDIELKSLDVERKKKRVELNMLTEEDTKNMDETEHMIELIEEIEQIKETEFCSNFEISNDPSSVLSGLGDEGDYNIVIIDPAYDAFKGYGEKSYTGSGISLSIYKKFGLFGEKHYLNLQAGESMINIKTSSLKPKIKALIHAVGPSYRGDFNNFYEYLDKTIKSIFDNIKALKRDGTIDEQTVIRFPLISVSDNVGGRAVSDRAGVYFPRYIDLIKKYFSKPVTGKEVKKCELFNPLILYIPDEYYTDFEKYKLKIGIQECWVYDFDGVVHNIVTENNDETLKGKGFDKDWTKLKDNLNDEIINDMRSGNDIVKIKVISGNKEIFKQSTYELLINNGVDIELNDIIFGLQGGSVGRVKYLNDLIVNRNTKIVKYVDDFWKNIETVYNSYSSGYLNTLKFLYWYSSTIEEMLPINILKPLPDLRENIAKQKFSNEIENDPSKLNFLENSYKLLTTYERGYGFPEWSINYVIENFDALDKTRVYYDMKDENMIDDIVKLVKEREPCNIESRGLYDKKKMKRDFGFSIGYYDRYYEDERKLLPNIAVFSETPVRGPFDKEIAKNVKIISSIGYAFDNQNQSDYRYFFGDEFNETKKNELIENCKNIFNKIFQCAADEGCNTIIFSLVGGGVFSAKYPGGTDNFIKEIFSPCFNEIKRQYDEVMIPVEFNIKFMGTGKLKDGKVTDSSYFRRRGFEDEYDDIGYFPDNIEKVETDDSLFVNAWDMLTVPGNGNFSDNSLDGYIGRFTSVGVLGTGLTNPRIQKKGQYYNGVFPPGSENFAKNARFINFPKNVNQDQEKQLRKEFKKRSSELRSVYGKGFEFPEWSIFYVINNSELLRQTRVYYDELDKDKQNIIERLVYQREPVNIGSGRRYDQNKLDEIFKYTKGYYDEYFDEEKSLAPNIAIFTKAGVRRGPSDYVKVNIINSIGYAFDSENQSDYKYFFGNNFDAAKKNELIIRYKNIFNKIFHCACDRKFNTIVFSLIGGGAFSSKYPDGGTVNFIKEIFVPAFNQIKNLYHNDMASNSNPFFINKFDIKFMGTDRPGNSNFFTELGFDEDYEDIGYFPQNIDKIEDNIDGTLFVNAWDMLSVPGNGNFSDNSLDGYTGRYSTVGVLGTGLTNPFIRVFTPEYYTEVLSFSNPFFASKCDTILSKEEKKEEEEEDLEKIANVTERKNICGDKKFYTITEGILSGYYENKENNWVVIDPGGAAFQGGSKIFQGGALSGEIYKRFEITGKEHGYTSDIDYCDARVSNADLSGKVKLMIHSVGPDGRVLAYNNPLQFYLCLERCIRKISELLKQPDVKERLEENNYLMWNSQS